MVANDECDCYRGATTDENGRSPSPLDLTRAGYYLPESLGKMWISKLQIVASQCCILEWTLLVEVWWFLFYILKNFTTFVIFMPFSNGILYVVFKSTWHKRIVVHRSDVRSASGPELWLAVYCNKY